VDGPRIERAVANLVRNALEHTPEGGRVDVSVRAADGWIALDVADTGDGIAPAHLPRIWQRFYRAEASRARRGGGDGAGLGLAIVRGFVEAHGGQVDVASEPRHGSTFTIRLPAVS
jgi:signal transduction histidine kinase